MSRRPPTRGRLAVAAGGAAASWLLSTGAAWAHEGHGASPVAVGAGGGPLSWLVSTVVLASSVTAAGIVLAAALARGRIESTRRAERAVLTLVWLAAAIDVAVVAHTRLLADGADLQWAGPLVAVHAVLALTVSLVRWAPVRLGAAAALVAVSAWVAHGGTTLSLAAVLLGVHLTAVAVWVGAFAWVALLSGPWTVVRLRSSVRTFGPAAAAASGATVATGGLTTAVHLAGIDEIPRTAFGRGAVAEVGLAAAAVALGIVWRRAGAATVRRAAMVAEAAVLAVAVGVGSFVGAVPPPAAALDRGRPVVRTVDRIGGRVSVVVAPNRTGRNIVSVTSRSDASFSVDGRRVAVQRDTGGVVHTTGVVELTAGTHRLVVDPSDGGGGATIVFATGRAPHGAALDPETAASDTCAGELVGAALAAASTGDGDRHDVLPPVGCHDDEVALAAGAGRAFAAALRAGSTSARIAVVAEDSARTEALVHALGASLPGAAVRVVDPTAPEVDARGSDAVIVATAAGGAGPAIARFGQSAARGVFLAPWLLSPAVLTPPGRWGPQLTIALPVDPNGAPAARYLAATRRLLGDADPTLVGLLGFVSGSSGAGSASRPMQLFSPVDVAFLPPSLAAGHAHGGTDGASSAWVRAGRLLPIGSVAR